MTCATGTYLLNGSCYTQCPNGYYANSPDCSACDAACAVCSGNPTPCSSCTVGNYLHLNSCGTCPSGFFPHEATRVCRDCSVYCVTATINMSFTSDTVLAIVIEFSQNVNFSTIPYQSFQKITKNDSSFGWNKFDIAYEILNDKSYRISITLQPGMIIMDNALFTVAMEPYSTDYYSADGNLFSLTIYTLTDSKTWTYLQHPSLGGDAKIFIDSFSSANTALNSFFGTQYVQEIKKSGVFMFLMPGAQLSASVVLHNGQPAQNAYEGNRFFSSFVFFDVPPWEE